MTFPSDKFKELERRKKAGEDPTKSICEVYGYFKYEKINTKKQKKQMKKRISNKNSYEQNKVTRNKNESLEDKLNIRTGTTTEQRGYPGYIIDKNHLELLWWAHINHGSIYTKFCINDGVLCFAAHTSGDSEHRLYGLDAYSGDLLWDYKGTTGRIRISESGAYYAKGTFSNPVIQEGKVYFGTSDHKVYALDTKTGKKLWDFKAGGQIKAPCCVDEETVYAASWDNNLYALKNETGGKLWESKIWENREAYPREQPFVHNNFIYLEDGSCLISFDKATGEKKWTFDAKDDYFKVQLVNDTLYVASKRVGFVALDPVSGKRIWSSKGKKIDYWTVEDNIAYICSKNKNKSNKIYALDLHDFGKKIGGYRLPYKIDWVSTQYCMMRSAPAVENGIAYFGSSFDNFYAVDVIHKKKLWENEIVDSCRYLKPIIKDGIVIVGDRYNQLQALDKRDGEQKWVFDAGEFNLQLNIVNDILYVMTNSRIFVLKPKR